jgi:hypothetical protein
MTSWKGYKMAVPVVLMSFYPGIFLRRLSKTIKKLQSGYTVFRPRFELDLPNTKQEY